MVGASGKSLKFGQPEVGWMRVAGNDSVCKRGLRFCILSPSLCAKFTMCLVRENLLRCDKYLTGSSRSLDFS